jgi:hypothetical protein
LRSDEKALQAAALRVLTDAPNTRPVGAVAAAAMAATAIAAAVATTGKPVPCPPEAARPQAIRWT